MLGREWSKLSTTYTPGGSGSGSGGGGSSTDVLSIIREKDASKREEGVRSLLKEIIATIQVQPPSPERGEEGTGGGGGKKKKGGGGEEGGGGGKVGDAVMVVCADVHYSSLTGLVDVPSLIAELKNLLKSFKYQDKIVKDKVVKSLQDALSGIAKVVVEEEDQSLEGRKQLMGMMMTVRGDRREGLKRMVEGRGKMPERGLLKEYLARCYLEAHLEMFDQHNRQVGGGGGGSSSRRGWG